MFQFNKKSILFFSSFNPTLLSFWIQQFSSLFRIRIILLQIRSESASGMMDPGPVLDPTRSEQILIFFLIFFCIRFKRTMFFVVILSLLSGSGPMIKFRPDQDTKHWFSFWLRTSKKSSTFFYMSATRARGGGVTPLPLKKRIKVKKIIDRPVFFL